MKGILVFIDKVKAKPARLKYQSYMICFITSEMWTRCKKKMRENQSHIKIKNYIKYNIQKGEKQ